MSVENALPAASQIAKKLILAQHGSWQQLGELIGDIPISQVDDLWEKYADDLYDARNEVRWHGAEVENIPPRIHYSWERNYEVDTRVINLGDGTGLAFNFVTGGGKHGDPEAYPWWDEAWLVKCTGTKTVVTHTYEDMPAPEQAEATN